MPTELEELVDFLHHGNTQIRQIATENLVPYSKTNPAIFELNGLTPLKDLKLLVKDYSPIARNALIILINLSSNERVLEYLAKDDAFLEALLLRVTNASEPNGDDVATLLANLAKSPALERLIPLQRVVVPGLSPSPLAITQLVELYNVGPTGKYNKSAKYDYLSYLFADLAKYPSFQIYLTTPPPHTALDPLTILLPFTTHSSHTRRLGTATTLRNLALGHTDPLYLLQPSLSILPPILLPLCGSDQSNITPEEMELLPEDCQYLTPEEHTPEGDTTVLQLLLETLYLLIARSGETGREIAREKGVYIVVRELHLRLDDEKVQKACETIVDIVMGGHDEDDMEAKRKASDGIEAVERVKEVADEEKLEEEVDNENEITPIF